MNKRATRYFLLLLFWLTAAVLVAQENPTTAQIRQILQDRIDKNKKSVGIVVGLIDKNGSHVVGYGKLGQEKNQMYDFLSRYQLTRGIGEKYEYSNYGAGLLGHLLTLKAGMDYETLVTKRICAPLKMSSTAIKLSPAMQTRLAKGHNEVLRPASNWDIPTLAGAGALRSTANDLLLFVAANLGLTKSALTPTLQKTHAFQHGTDSPNLQIALAWHILQKDSSEIIWHNGGTGGYHSFI